MRHPRHRRTFSLFGITAQSRRLRCVIAAASFVAASTLFSNHACGAYPWQKLARAPKLSTLMGPRPTSTLDWWSSEVEAGKQFELHLDRSLSETLRLFQVPSARDRRQADAFVAFEFGAKTGWVSNLYWHVDFNEIPDFDDKTIAPIWLMADSLLVTGNFLVPNLQPHGSFDGTTTIGLGPLLRAPKPAEVPVAMRSACPIWRVSQPIAFSGLGGEGDRFAIVDCNGIVSADAIDRLSVIGRLPGSPHPTLPLPIAPETNPRFKSEWVEGVHLLHPRLLGLIQQIAMAYPNRTIAVYSGYRRDRRQTSPHVRGRALDLSVPGVPNESLYAFCRTLPNSGCGYYPNQPFVHLDVREESRGSVAWVDIALPGQASVYTEIWPISQDELARPEIE